MKNQNKNTGQAKVTGGYSRPYRHSKGAGTTVGSIMMIVIFLMFFGVFLYMSNNRTQTNIQLNLESLQLLRLKSTFETFNQSLGMTWFISTVQSVFATADDSIGCGIDDGRVPAGYWLKTDPTKSRNKSAAVLMTNGKKYSDFGLNPIICYPQDNHVKDYISKTLLESGYLNLIRSFSVGGINMQLEQNSRRDAVDALFEINLLDDHVNSKFSQKITARYESSRSEIVKTTENFNLMKTLLRPIVESARRAIGLLLVFGDSMYVTNQLSYRPSTQSADAYINQFSSVIKSLAISPSLTNVDQSVSVKTDISGVDSSNAGVFDQAIGHGLVAHYIATITYTEGMSSSPATRLSWPTDSRAIKSCYGPRQSPTDGSGQFHEGIDIGPSTPSVGENIYAVADGTIISITTICPTGNIPPGCSYGNKAIIDHGGFYSFYAHLESISVQAGQQVSQGTVIGVMGNTGVSTGIHLHFEIRTPDQSTRANPCRYIDCTQSTLKTCEGGPGGDSSDGYYYHDTTSNIFYKRPVSLEYTVEDYVPALDCQQYSQLPPRPTFFNWQVSNDMACCAGFVFSCNANIPKLAAGQSIALGSYTGENLDCDNNLNSLQCICNNILSGRVLKCSDNGFSVGQP